jgi:peptidoglycan/LPS O-acetylase OafA/YrhL
MVDQQISGNVTAEAPPEQRQETRRMPVLDGIRGLAIVLVLFGHGLSETPLHLFALGIGYTGVSIFFVLSGYLITRILLAEEERTGTVSLSRFYKRRALRIFPACYLFLIVLAFLAWTGVIPAPDRSTWTASLLYFRNLLGSGWETGHLWTLGLEEQFYFFWPFLFMMTPRRLRLRMILVAVIIFTAWRAYVLYGGHYNGGIYARPDLRMDTFLIGGAFAITDWTFVRNTSAALYTALFISWSIIGPAYLVAVDTSVAAVLIGGLITWLAKSPGTTTAKFFSLPVAVSAGVLSYSLYLWQQLFLGPRLRWWSLPTLIIVACLSYFLIERPFLRLRSTTAL